MNQYARRDPIHNLRLPWNNIRPREATVASRPASGDGSAHREAIKWDRLRPPLPVRVARCGTTRTPHARVDPRSARSTDRLCS